MRVAIVHDYIKEYGGAERVLEALHEIWPGAPVYTSVYLPKFLGPHKDRFKKWNIKTSWLQLLPFKSKLISPIRLITPFVFKSFDFSNFDIVIISSTGAYVKEFNPDSIGIKLKTVVYCHTPPRYLYGYATAREWKNNLVFRVLGEVANHFLRLIDFKSSQNVDFFIANSKNVGGRIKKFYRRDSIVIYPPVGSALVANENFLARSSRDSYNSTKEFKMRAGKNFVSSPRRFYLTGGRIAKPKHIDLIVKAFEKLDLPLKVFGRSFANSSNDLTTQSPNIQFLGEVSDEEKLELMSQAKAFVFASQDEDFGITPVEAMSVGTPVIAYRSGGVVESIVHGITGLFFDELSIESLSKAVKDFEKAKFDKELIIKHAQKFSKERFKKEIRDFIMNSK